MELKTLIAYLEDESSYVSNRSVGYINTAFYTRPEDYLFYAVLDMESKLPHRAINTLANCKRALTCQVDRLLKLLGYYNRHSNVDQLGFYDKVGIIKLYGITIPERSAEIIYERNQMDHKYNRPTPQKVAEYVEQIDAFVKKTRFFTSKFPPTIEYSNHLKQEQYGFYGLSIHLDHGTPYIIIKVDKKNIVIHGGSPDYIEVLKRHIWKAKYFLEEGAEPKGGTSFQGCETGTQI